jgi:hypothetical protein
MTRARRPRRAVSDALHKRAHEEVLDLISAKPAITPGVVTGSMQLQDEQ